LIDKHDTDIVNLPNSINYIAKTTIYDSQTTTSGALGVMMSQYSNANAWHYTDSVTGETPDLHHAILYKNLGGGIAYVGAICILS
jgi:hypothetical protein